MNVLTPNGIRKKMRQGLPSIGTWLQIPSPDVAEILAHAGYDWLVIDMEHGSIDMGQLPALLRAIACVGGATKRLEGHTPAHDFSQDPWAPCNQCSPPTPASLPGPLALVRVPTATPIYIRRALDAGAQGLILPMIERRAQLDEAIAAASYPKVKSGVVQGARGVGYCRANGYGQYFAQYSQKIAQDVLLVAQIEHKDAVQNIESLVSHPRLDALMVGPYDLSASLGVTGQLDHPDVRVALQHIIHMCKKYQLPVGMHVVDANLLALKEVVHQGYTFVAYGLDALFLWKHAACPVDKTFKK